MKVYELKCPTCGHMVKMPFVRVGAMVSCDKCDHRYAIRDVHVKHKVQNQGVKPRPAEEPPKPEPEPEPEPIELSKQADADGTVIGLSGLSQMMRNDDGDTPRAAVNPPPSAAVPAARGRPRFQTPNFDAAAALHAWRKIRPMYLALGGLLAIIVVLGVGIFIISSNFKSQAARTAVRDNPTTAELRPTIATLREPLRLEAEPLDVSPFTDPGDPTLDADRLIELAGAPPEARRLAPGDVWIENVSGHGRLRIDAINGTGRRCQRILFVITAEPPDASASRYWVVRCNEPMDSGEGIAVMTEIADLNAVDGVRLYISAAGW